MASFSPKCKLCFHNRYALSLSLSFAGSSGVGGWRKIHRGLLSLSLSLYRNVKCRVKERGGGKGERGRGPSKAAAAAAEEVGVLLLLLLLSSLAHAPFRIYTAFIFAEFNAADILPPHLLLLHRASFGIRVSCNRHFCGVEEKERETIDTRFSR